MGSRSSFELSDNLRLFSQYSKNKPGMALAWVPLYISYNIIIFYLITFSFVIIEALPIDPAIMGLPAPAHQGHDLDVPTHGVVPDGAP